MQQIEDGKKFSGDFRISDLQRTLINVINSSLVILLYFSKHFYVIMKIELLQEKIVREKIYGPHYIQDYHQ